MNKLRIGKKDYFSSLCKNFYLFEKMLLRMIGQKMKEHQEVIVDPSNYSEVMKKDKAEKKYRKGLLRLEEEVKYVRHVKLALDEKRKEIEEEEKSKQKKQEMIENLQMKAKLRHEELEKVKRIWSVTPDKTKPKYLQMEESFRINKEFSEAQRTRSELAKKSYFMKAINRDEIIQHSKNYERAINEAKKRREIRLAEMNLDTSVNSVNIFKRSIVAEQEEKITAKKNMAAKRKNYGDIVRELFSPKIDIKILYSERAEPRKPTPISFREKEGKKSPKLSNGTSYKIVKKKPTPESFTPKNDSKSETRSESKFDANIEKKKKNYLNELRVKRSEILGNKEFAKIYNSFTSGEFYGDRKDVLKKLKSIEKFVMTEEHKIKLQDKPSMVGIERESKINDLLIQSVKAKVQMLESN